MDLEDVERALAAGDFGRAQDLLSHWKGPESATLLDLRGRSAYGSGDLEACLAAYEALHRLHREQGRSVEAALAAVTVGMYLMMDTGLMATVRAWLGRGEALLADAPDSPVWAWLYAVRTYERFMCGDMRGAGECARQAIERGDRHGTKPPVIIGRTALGRVQIHEGRVDEGLAMLDEVALELTSGNLDPMTSGQMWCELICAMQWVGQHDRAEEWTEAMERWRKGAAFGGLNGRCRIHRAEVLRMRGPCEAAEQEALLACEELRPWMRREFGWPLTELGNVRLRKGDFVGAEEAFLAAIDNAWSPQPGLSLLRLAQGRAEEAWALIDSALSHPYDIPSKEHPPAGGLRRAPLLDALTQIALATGRVSAARAAADELAEIAKTYRSRTLENAARAARGRIEAAEGRPETALSDLTGAMVEWVELRMPFEAATLRLDVARAHLAAGNADTAEIERQAARRMFQALGAVGWVERIDATPTQVGERDSRTPSNVEPDTDAEGQPSPRALFLRKGDMRHIRFADSEVHVKDLKGMRYLERLLPEPGREFHALDLIEVERGALPTAPKHTAADLDTESGGQTGLEVFDREAREAYRRRLAEVEADIEEAEAHNDLERATLARADRQFLVDELARGVGLGGPARRPGERAARDRHAANPSVRFGRARNAEQ
ncbi:MAG: hypothetical protein OXR73_03025, partial [Myxococcales bacterium]|nr:hypothetical protein [Myxococcales bacterium]